ncbi:MAG: hypothetical protein ACLQVF_46620 [Isosphaeraceae bacterium]
MEQMTSTLPLPRDADTEAFTTGTSNVLRISRDAHRGKSATLRDYFAAVGRTSTRNRAQIVRVIVIDPGGSFIVSRQTRPDCNLQSLYLLHKLAIPADVQAFCSRKQLGCDLARTLELASTYFPIAGEPTFRVVEDAECDASYIAIHVNVEGTVEKVFQQSESFLDEFVTSIDKNKQRHISLVYHAI